MNRRGLARLVAALAAGLLFGVGLVVGGMTQPAKVVGFLDFAGRWDPSLAFVMAGAVAVFMPLVRHILRRAAPVCEASFAVPKRRDIDPPLILGAALFGVGWGLGGYCPGPGLTAAGSLAPQALVFVAAMFVGFGTMRAYDFFRTHLQRRRKDDRSQASGQPA